MGVKEDMNTMQTGTNIQHVYITDTTATQPYYVVGGGAGGIGTTTWTTANGIGAGGAGHAHDMIVNGTLTVSSDIEINGKSLTEMIESIENRLAILHPNEKLEKKWAKLKELGDEYRALEAEILEGEDIWDILKK
jgi:hypothetical protein